MITLESWDPIDVYYPPRHGPDDPPKSLTVVYLIRHNGSRIAWMGCFGDHAILWWLPAEHPLAWPNFNATGWSIASPYPDSPFWFISGRFEDALEYLYNGIRAVMEMQ